MSNRRTHSSYKALYRIKPVLTQIGDIKLPFPISWEMAAIFVMFLGIYYLFFGRILVSLLISLGLVPWMIIVAFSVFSAWATSKIDAEGKFVPLFLIDYSRFFVRKKYHSFNRKIKNPNRKVRINDSWKLGVDDWTSR